MNDIIDAINRLNENSWMDYVQLGATVISIIISALAVIYAVKVPKKIAEEQNSIALFEKRYEFFSMFCKCISFAQAFENDDSIESIRRVFLVAFSENDSRECDIHISIPLKVKVIEQLKQGYYLFDFETKLWIQPLIKHFTKLLTVTDEDFSETQVEKFKKAAADADDNLKKKLEETMRLSLR